MDKYEVIKFKDNEFEMDVNVSPNEGTIWVTQKQMAILFNVDISRISRHIKNAIGEKEINNLTNLRKTQIANSDKTIFIYDFN